MIDCVLLHSKVMKAVSVKLFTVTEVDLDTQTEVRIYSSNQQVYPLGSSDTIVWDAWAQRLYLQHQSYVVNRVSKEPEVFTDHEKIMAIGCNSCLNVPITKSGKVIAVMNLLHEADWFTHDRIAVAEAIATEFTSQRASNHDP